MSVPPKRKVSVPVMSSPRRQLNARRLPPLPGMNLSNRHHSVTSHHGSPPLSRSPNHMGIFGIKSVINSKPSTIRSHPTSAFSYLYPELSPELVSQYLNDNPEFLDNYVLSSVDEERIQNWSLRKGRPTRVTKHAWHMTNGDARRDYHRETASKTRWKTTVQTNKWKVLHELTRDISQQTNRSQILTELAKCAKTCVNADGYNLYLMDEQNQLRYHNPQSSGRRRSSSGRPEIIGMTLPSYVSYTKETIRSSEIREDSRFPKGLGTRVDNAQSVIAVPILNGSDGVMGVIELYRYCGNIPFSSEDEEVAASLLVWADMFVEYVEMYNSMTKQRRLNDFLLAVTKSIFQDIVSMDTVIMKIMNYAKKLGNADRASLFLLDTNTNELYARIFDTGKTEEKAPQKEIRFPMDKGVAGFVASTGRILNIADAYTDRRFNRDVDQQTGYRTKSILCMPIYIRGSIIGVVQMVNKIDGAFNRADEESFETFAIYCGLALHHAKLYDKIRRSEQKFKVALDVLSYHSQCAEDEYQSVKAIPIPKSLPEIVDYDYSPWSVTNEMKPVYVLYMMRDIFNEARYDISEIIKFTLTVRKNYRNVPYHNWAHAFSVAHAMFTVIKTASHRFSPIECLALYVACLCHDLDHRGKTNAYMVKMESPLASVYSTSTMEHHHFNHTITILQNDGHNIFKHLSSEEYKTVLDDIRHCILATDLALFFGNRARLQEIADKNEFSWDNKEHRKTIMANCMTACDLCSMYKPWETQLDLVNVIMEEFWQQGDEERSQGITPMPMMDRQKKNELPHLEVGFLIGICLPCYELMARILPETKPMVDGAVANLKKWKELAEEHKDDSCEDEQTNSEVDKNEVPSKTADNTTSSEQKIKDNEDISDLPREQEIDTQPTANETDIMESNDSKQSLEVQNNESIVNDEL